jgi:phage tail sheath gpL-like
VGVQTKFKNLAGGRVRFLPQRIAILAQGATASQSSYSLDKAQILSAKEAGDTYGYGSPIHLAADELFPANGDGVGTIPVTVYPLNDEGAAVAAAGDITPSGSATKDGTYYIRIGGILSDPFTIPSGTINVADFITAATAAIQAVLKMPFIPADGTTKLNLTAKWAGTTGNDILVEVIGPSYGLVFTIVQPATGATDPSAANINTALAQMGNVWETMLINGFAYDDETILDVIDTFNEGRWDALVRKPLIAFVGTNEAALATATAVSDTRKTDRTNCQLVAPGSPNVPIAIAARQVARIAKVANNNPPTSYGAQRITGILPGTDGEQWTYPQRDSAVKKGSSTVEVVDGEVQIGDIATMYHPTGEDPPAYRWAVSIVKVQNILYNVGLIFDAPEWASAPLIPDDQPTVNPNARKPRSAIAQVRALLDNLGLQAIISDPETAKANTTADINGQNPDRLDVETTVQISGNSRVKAVTLNWGFYFGAVAA